MLNNKKSGYTLTEVIITMLIIAVIVAVSIKITKTKLNSIVSLTYYAAYSTIKTAASSMYGDFRNHADYTTPPADWNLPSVEDNPHCGMVANPDGTYAPIPGFNRECSTSAYYYNNQTCNCEPIPRTIPISGQNFCDLFVKITNTTGDSCNGTEITDQTNFNGLTADITLRNGVTLFNVKHDPVTLPQLDGNTENRKFISAAFTEGNDSTNTEIDIDEIGYVIYADINGHRNAPNELWDDVYPFYVTLGGKVIPGYNGAGESAEGGNSKLHLQVSIYNDSDSNWVAKSVSFQEGACKMHYVNSPTYCNGVDVDENVCKLNESSCRLKTIMPVRFL